MYKNSEGYSDPTAGIAIGRVMREYKLEQKEKWRRQHELKNRPKVYVASKYAGDINSNVANAIRYCQYVIEKKCMPVASHLTYPVMLNDADPHEREMGLMFGLALLAICDEVWCFGEISQGMELEINEAKRLGKKICYFKGAV
ncbi:MAG: hypothetical protein PHE51_02150 [Eubacteriales bacterium]|nr:hypothetical protein [Eubacteriales bacterium]